MLKTLVRMYRHAQTRHLQEDIYKTLDAGGFEERSMGKAELKQELPGGGLAALGDHNITCTAFPLSSFHYVTGDNYAVFSIDLPSTSSPGISYLR